MEAYDESASAELKIEERTGRKEETDDDFSEDNPLSDRRLSVVHQGIPSFVCVRVVGSVCRVCRITCACALFHTVVLC